ncbi:TPA: hypothetical protein I9088_001370 [Clostridium perfringens]|nr:hypothetical protein [Clostridium perfringens]HAT4283488.1 hypothetical protein [Clostridium perfringens]HAT4312896.1 hypothetical protein [Clostridium perfringens]
MSKIENGIYIEDFSESPFFDIKNWQVVNFDNKKILVSNKIGDNSSTILEFKVTTNKIEIDYGVSSESNYDKFYIFIDDVEKVCISGLQNKQTLTENLDFGEHKVTFKYSKDSSNGRNRDRGEIFEIRYKIPYKELFLIKDGNSIKGFKDKVLTVLENKIAIKEDFLNYGLSKLELNQIIKNRTAFQSSKPKILFYTDNPKPDIKLYEKGTPHGEIVSMKNSVILDKEYIQYIKDINVDATVGQNSILKFIFSKDDGNSWITFYDNRWGAIGLDNISLATKGIDLNTLNNLTEEQLKLISDTRKIKIAWYMKRGNLEENITIKQIKIDYKTNL